ncbi:biofilm peroxide resistance protein BsmA [Cedecea davisae]|uniref:Biofilm peroxide resistance protein BsmA n=1 Tax=Cedecea davisae TaxID=158484 RepID=A0ABS6DEG3_9ENTR|nr:biofilm peroxide resistance protein BsmA [Cedecea davisae]MBU4681583.1 biofilm peroxide resistance protein BsmA [Cedecea davisae]MBU4689349.1 biofilm peroxide resistance protein BsmA [Cedecea davisae]
MTVKKRETIMLRLSVLITAALLSACSVLQGSPQPAPPLRDYPQEVQRPQTAELTKIGTVSAVVRGSPMDSEAIIKKKAAAAKADYYLIIMNDETVIPGQWYTQAILYRK